MCLILRTRSVLGPAGVTREHCARAVLVQEGNHGLLGLLQECQGMWSLGLDLGVQK